MTIRLLVIDQMQAAGKAVQAILDSGQLTVICKQDAYLKQGYFDPDWMIDFRKRSTETPWIQRKIKI